MGSDPQRRARLVDDLRVLTTCGADGPRQVPGTTCQLPTGHPGDHEHTDERGLVLLWSATGFGFRLPETRTCGDRLAGSTATCERARGHLGAHQRRRGAALTTWPSRAMAPLPPSVDGGYLAAEELPQRAPAEFLLGREATSETQGSSAVEFRVGWSHGPGLAATWLAPTNEVQARAQKATFQSLMDEGGPYAPSRVFIERRFVGPWEVVE